MESPQENSPNQFEQNRRLVGAAAILILANIVQRLLGMGREIVTANLFGASAALSAFNLAKLVPDTLYQLIAGGEMMNSSLVPVFSDFASGRHRRELWSAFNIILSLVILVLSAVVILVEIFAPQIAWLVGAGNLEDPALFPLTVSLLRLTAPVMLFLSISSVMMAVLYALQRFTLPAFTTAIFNAAIILVALLRPDTVASLAWGMIAGSIAMIALQLPVLRDATFRLNVNWRHPVVRHVLLLYAPIVLGLVVNQAGIFIGYNLATRTGDASVNYMRYSTTLYQLPIGLVVVALSTAILPTLSRQASGQLLVFKQTLAQGLKLVIALILPATAGLFALALPIIQLIFEHGKFLPADSLITSMVLRIDLIGLPFAAVDLMLVYASYARKDTLRPALVGVVSVVFYVIVALLLLRPLGLLGLMAANAGKLVLHAAIMIWLLHRQLDGLRGFGLSNVLIRSAAAAAATGLAAYGAAAAVAGWFGGDGLPFFILQVALPGGIGGLVYGLMVWLLDIGEIKNLSKMIRAPRGSGKPLP